MTMMAIWNGTVLAESDKSTTCPWKGRAGYYTVVAGSGRAARVPAAALRSQGRGRTVMTRTSTSVSFPGSAGDDLAARLDLPDGEPVAFALFAHCFSCSKDIAAASRISRGLVAQGFGVLRFDFTGLGASGGEFANTNFSSNVEDLRRAAAMLRARYRAPALLVGHSLGGAAVLAAAPSIPEVKAVATIGAPFDPGHIAHLFPPHTLAELERVGEADVELAGRTFRVRRQLLDDANAQNLTRTLARLGRALLVLHSPTDEIVDVDNARQIFEAARHPKSFVSLDGADHLLTRAEDADYVATVLAGWAGRYLSDRATAATGEREATPGEGTVTITDSGPGTLSQAIRAGRHRLVADEPLGIGDDLGPTPYDLLLAALGTCTSMTLRMYADRHDWPLEQVTVRLEHDRVHATDCRDPEAHPCVIDHIDRTIRLDGRLTAEQQARLLALAERCPVHRTLTGEVRVATRLA
jgi:putative redox protein